jgi:hypothetical protein
MAFRASNRVPSGVRAENVELQAQIELRIDDPPPAPMSAGTAVRRIFDFLPPISQYVSAN